ncbi:hypothetical protein MOQ_004350 [Trypanosoma cruzi marinkellei]|uniref:RING-type domain-containing protein n=1 Tax=Trypanosoma cruzi marinkellei TaxID=85056 RepID=K2N1F3_TRYCR|nr:hypothetical protein MOQ_004350 [Trypanosoma cruzi marinkellei]
MVVIVWLSFILCASATISIIIGAIIYYTYDEVLQQRAESLLFDQPGVCSVVYINCAVPIVTLTTGTISRQVKIWDNIDSRYFCMVPSPAHVPCWWSKEKSLSRFVRIGPVLPVTRSLRMFSVALMALGGLVIVTGITYLYIFRGKYSEWLRRNRDASLSGRPQQQEGRRGTEMIGQSTMIEESKLPEAYPMSDPNWMEEATTQTAYARRRLDVLGRFFEARRMQFARREGSSEPFGFLADSNMETEYDEEDFPVDECYVCLSRFRRRMIWWPCGHWLCASCARKVLRKTVCPGYASCPSCRGSFLREDLLVLHLFPRAVTPVAENVPQNENSNENGNRISSIEIEETPGLV